MTMITLTEKDVLPEDGASGTLVGRVWLPQVGGPAVVAVRNDGLFDVSAQFPTVSALCEQHDPAQALRGDQGRADRRSRRASWPTRRPTDATRKSRGCSRRSTCRC